MEAIITRNPIRCEIAHDGKKVMSMSEFVNIMKNKDKNDKYGKDMVSKLLKDDSPHKAYLESLGIYKLKNARGPATPAMTFLGLKGLLSKLNFNIADEYTNYCSKTTTRVEAGDSSMKQVIDANAASSSIYNAMARDALPHLAEAKVIAADADVKKKIANADAEIMKDAADESEMQEISTGGNFALFMAQVCISFF